MAFELLEPPGYTDIPDTVLAPSAIASGFVFSALKDNASFGSVCPEVFYATYTNGETVDLPTSPVDGYQYQRDELIYVWEIQNTLSNASGTPSAPSGLLWGEWFIEPDTGLVHCIQAYGTNSLNAVQQTNDGTLGVWTFGIRGRKLRSIAAGPPAYTDLPGYIFAEDNAAQSTNLKNLSHNAKLASVQCEIIPVNPSNAPAWQPNTFYAAGSLVQPTGAQASGFWFIAANSGNSGSLEPTWPGVWHGSAPINDGGVIWNIAGAGFYNGQQIPFPVSPVDGYAYSAADQIVPFFSFISTQSMPIQKGHNVLFTSGQCVARLNKSVSAIQPDDPDQSSWGGTPPSQSVANLRTLWPGPLQNWLAPVAAPAAPSLGYTAGGTLAATTYYVKITYTSSAGETTTSAESSLAVPANNLLTVASPSASGSATGWNVYIATASGGEQLQVESPNVIGTGYTLPTTGLVSNVSPPASNTTGFVRSAAEASVSGFLSPGAATTGVGIVNCSVTYAGPAEYADGTLMVWLLCFRQIAAMSSPGGANFTDFATDALTSGNPLRSDYMEDVNENAKFSILRPEIFFYANVAPGTAVFSTPPVSPVDGYHYSAGECTYMWCFTYTGHDAGDLRDFSIYVDPITGVVNTQNDYYRTTVFSGGSLARAVYGQGGLLEYKNMGGNGRGEDTLNVIVIARRNHETELQTPVVIEPGGQQPALPGPANLLPNGNFAIWSIPNSVAATYAGVADDWGVLQTQGKTQFLQWAGIGNSLFAQAIGALPAGTNLSQRQTIPPPGGTNIAAIASEIVPVWPGGQYAFSFIAASHAYNDGDYIGYGFYARIHVLAADANGEPDLSTDTSFDLLGPDLTLQPGTSVSNNPGGGISQFPPNFNTFKFTFTVPIDGSNSVLTSVGLSVLSQTVNFTPAYLYVEFQVWDITSSGIDHVRYAIIDNVVLQDLTAGSTNLNQQGSIPSSGDNSDFTYSQGATTSNGFTWTDFSLWMPDGTQIPVAAGFKLFTGLTPGTTYYWSCTYGLGGNNPSGVIFYHDTVPMESQNQIAVLGADGFIPIFANWTITQPSSGTGGGGGTTGGASCFTGAIRVKTAKGWIPFDELPDEVEIVNERGTFTADLIVHENRDEWCVPLGAGMVTVTHDLLWAGRWIQAGKLFKNVAPERFRGTLYDLHVRTEREEEKRYIVERGWIAHNLFVKRPFP